MFLLQGSHRRVVTPQRKQGYDWLNFITIIAKMRLNCMNSGDTRLVGVTKMREDYMWRSTGNMTKECTSYAWNVAMNLNLKFTRPHPGMVLWIRIGGSHLHFR